MSPVPASTEKGFTLGAEPKKVAALLLIVAIGIVLWWRNSTPDTPTSSGTRSAAGDAKLGALAMRQQQAALTESPAAGTRISRRHGNQNEKNVFEMRPIDPSRGDVDPTLRLELLERLKTVKLASAGRSLFEIGAAPPPPMVTGNGPKIIPKPKPGALGAPVPVQVQNTPPAPPPAPPIPLKFYGFIRPVNKDDARRGFFMDGDVILVAKEGELVNQRYKVVKFQETSAAMEDTVTKSQQTLTLVPEAKGEN